MTGKAGAWWAERSLRGVLTDLIVAEMARLRPGRPPLPRHLLGPETAIGADPATGENVLGADSLEVLNLSVAVSRMFHVHETGLDDAFLFRRSLRQWADLVIQSRRHADGAITFATSGSTGTPKLADHSMADLEREIGHLCGLFGDRRRIVAAQPRHHIYGFLFTFMLPAALDLDFVDRRDALPSALLGQAEPGDLVVAHPTLLELATQIPVSVAEDVTVVTSTGPCPRSVWDRLAAAGVSRIVEVYGSTETGGVGYREHPDDAYLLMPHWRRGESEGDGDAIRPVGGGVTRVLGDRLEWVDACRFRVGRRLDEAVQIAGGNVFPGRVRSVLLDHPDVAEAAVRLMRPEEGARLKAFVVPRSGSELSADEITAWLEERLSSLEVPRAIRFGPALPRTDAGKTTDWDAA